MSIVDVNLTLDTNIYASGDVLAATQAMEDITRFPTGSAILQTVTVIDKDDQGAAFDIWLMSADVAIGTENAAPNISDANAAAGVIGRIAIGTGDYYDLGGVKVAHLTSLAMPIQAAINTKKLYVAVVNGTGTPTYTALGVVLRFGILQDD